MPSLSDAVGQELIWSQPSRMRQAFELRAGDNAMGSLEFEHETLAWGAVEDQHWSPNHEGFWHPQVTVRKLGSDDNVAIFKPR